MDNEEISEKGEKVLPPRKLNGSFYFDGVALMEIIQNQWMKWNRAELVCNGPIISFDLNGKKRISNQSQPLEEAGKKPRWFQNKFKTLKRPSPNGRIGFRTMDKSFGLEILKLKNFKMRLFFLLLCHFC